MQHKLKIGICNNVTSTTKKAIAQNNEIKEENLMNKLNRKIDSIMNMLSGKN
jgi:hypothetical protein